MLLLLLHRGTGTLSYCVKEHQARVHNRNVTSSALAEHWMSIGNLLDWDDARVLEPCQACDIGDAYLSPGTYNLAQA